MRFTSKFRFFKFLLFLAFWSCSMNPEEGGESSKGKEPIGIKPVWVYNDLQDSIYKAGDLPSGSLNLDSLIHYLNARFQGKVNLYFQNISGDTLFVRIPEASYLTQKMGTSGADSYLMESTFTLTELQGINHVFIDFIEGDHATPGVYNRLYFEEQIRRNKALNR